MSGTIRPIATVVAVIVLLLAGVGCIRWARRHSGGTQFVASAMMVLLGMIGPAVKPPQQGIEEVREDKGKKGSQPGASTGTMTARAGYATPCPTATPCRAQSALLDAIRSAQLQDRLGKIIANRSRRDPEPRGDSSRAGALSRELQDLTLARCERISVAAP